MSVQIQQNVITTYEQLSCSVCIVHFYIPIELYNVRQEDGATFYCPNGHGQCFRESTKSRLEKAQQVIDATRTQLALERDQKAATEKSLEQLKKRIGNGVCPCCHRQVKQLQRHIKIKHPDWLSK